MQILVEKVQFENDEDSLVIFEKQDINIGKKSLHLFRVCGDIMFSVYKININNKPNFLIQKISLQDPDIVTNLQHAFVQKKGNKQDYEKFLFNEVVDIFKVYNIKDYQNNILIIKTINGDKFEYYKYDHNNSEIVYSLTELNKRSLDISCTSNLFNSASDGTDKILLGTANGKVYIYTLSRNEIIKLNQYTATIKGLHYCSKLKELTCIIGVTIMKYKNIKEINEFNNDSIPLEIENYGSDDVNKQEIENIQVFENIKREQFLVNYKNELVVNKYTESLSESRILKKNDIFTKDNYVIDSCLTNYHILNITNQNKLNIINQFNYEDEINIEVEHSLADSMFLEVDYISNDLKPTYWLYDTANNVFEIILQDENLNVVDDLLKLNKFSEVLKFDLNDEEKKQSIYEQYFDYLLNEEEKNIDILIKVAGKIKKNFTLKMNQIIMLLSTERYKDTGAIKIIDFLKLRLINFNDSMTKNQIKLLLSLIVIFMTQLPASISNDKILREFLVQNLDLLDHKMTKQLLAKSPNNLIFFMKLSKDFKSLIKYYLIENNNFIEAVKVINVYCDDTEIIYDTAPILLQNCPEEIVKTWVKLIVNKTISIDINRLLNIFLDYFHKVYSLKANNDSIKKMPNFCLWFLMWYHSTIESVNKNVNDLIMYMLINDKNEFDLDKIISFIDNNWEYLDRFILLDMATKMDKESTQSKSIDVVVYILNRMKMYLESVKLALKEGLLDTARDIINNIDEDEAINDFDEFNDIRKLKRQLWLLIVGHTLNNSYKNNLNLKPIINDLIRESNDIINISDIFPIIESMNLTVAVIKDEFISNLKAQNRELSETNKEISNLINLRQKILEDIDYLNHNLSHEISESDVCAYCHDNLILKKKFYCFPCCHKLHVNCTLDLILKGGDFGLKNQIENIMFKKEYKWLDKLNLLLAKKCPICTDININNIDEPFVLDVASSDKNNGQVVGGVSNSAIDYLKF